MTTEYIEIREPIAEGETFENASERVQKLFIGAINPSQVVQVGDEAVGRIPFPVSDLISKMLTENLWKYHYNTGPSCPCCKRENPKYEPTPLKFTNGQ